MIGLKFENAPVFIIASERSGTNLLRKRLAERQDHYIGPSPAHFLKNLYYQQPYYGDLSVDENFKKFISDALDLCLVHFAPWEIKWTPEDIMSKYGENRRDAIHLMHYMMNRYAKEHGFEGYICKDNFLYEFALDIAAEIPGARFIYLYRDPRDFAISQMKRPNAIKSVARFAKMWEYEQTKAIAVAEALKSRGKCTFVSYEELIEDEDKEIDRILSFLGLERSENSKYSENIKENVHEWSNLSKATIKDNSNKFLHELSRRKIGIVEYICGRQMKYLGYEFVVGQQKRPSKAFLVIDIVVGFCYKKLQSIFSCRDRDSFVYKRSQILSDMKVNYRSDFF